ncbi:lysophospholipid acyltransferase family protein [Solimonas soli]|uniref:lysophospholipid acyltransferase family protein n=1 Tax=Solimonas soli TaxID=413479 RepID=UPI0004BA7D89|nr:lysophospholipid acyltransferase family protein [Solimonas soli]
MQVYERFKQLARLASREEWYRRVVTPEVEQLIARMPKPVGSFGYDAWGYSENAAKLGLGVIKLLYEKYFRVTAHGLDNIPAQGRVLVVANHSGQLPMDGMLIGGALAMNPHGPRAPRAMTERFFPTVPWLGSILTGMGAVIGDPLNCIKMLEQDEAIIVFPEGIRGSGKPYRKRYQLQRFGNGFMHLAMQTGAPIVPVGVVGCEETMPALANIAPLARLLGLPYVPLAPLLPLPARVYLNFGEAICFDKSAVSEEEVTARVELVKDKIRALIDRGLNERTSVF